MQKQDQKSAHPVLIIGAGRGGSAFLELFRHERLFRIIGVADITPDAPGFALAREQGIATFLDIEQALRRCAPCFAINLTHDAAISDLAAQVLGPSSIIGGYEAKLIWEMVSRLKRARDELETSQSYLQAIFNHTMDGILLLDAGGVVRRFNAAAEKIFGYTAADVIGRNVTMLMDAADAEHHDHHIRSYLESGITTVLGSERIVTARRSDGSTFDMELSANAMQLHGDHHFIGVIRDVSARLEAEEKIRRLAHYDSITQLPNRTLFFDRLEQAMALAKRHDCKLALLFLDLDGFKAVNDTHGHNIGDALLRSVAQRLKQNIRSVDTVARMGGDEFTLILNELVSVEDSAVVAGKLIDALRQPFDIEGHICRIGGSIGIAIYPDDSVDSDQLVQQADDAMYLAKKSGKSDFRYFSPEEMAKPGGAFETV